MPLPYRRARYRNERRRRPFDPMPGFLAEVSAERPRRMNLARAVVTVERSERFGLLCPQPQQGGDAHPWTHEDDEGHQPHENSPARMQRTLGNVRRFCRIPFSRHGSGSSRHGDQLRCRETTQRRLLREIDGPGRSRCRRESHGAPRPEPFQPTRLSQASLRHACISCKSPSVMVRRGVVRRLVRSGQRLGPGPASGVWEAPWAAA